MMMPSCALARHPKPLNDIKANLILRCSAHPPTFGKWALKIIIYCACVSCTSSTLSTVPELSTDYMYWYLFPVSYCWSYTLAAPGLYPGTSYFPQDSLQQQHTFSCIQQAPSL